MSLGCKAVQYCHFFVFKQKTAYDVRMSDWSSDVCSSDLAVRRRRDPAGSARTSRGIRREGERVSCTAPRPERRRGSHLRPAPSRGSLGRSEERRVGKECSVRVDLGGRRINKTKK